MIDGTLDPNSPKPVLKVQPCEACGGMPHGQASRELECFRMHLRGARLQMLSPAELAEWQAWKAIRADVQALPLSPHEKISKVKRSPCPKV